MRVLAVGAGGFVGSHVVGALAHTGWDLVVYDRPGNPRIEQLRAAGVEVMTTFAHRDPVDVVISLAATTDPAVALEDPVAAFTNGVQVMGRTLEYARTVGARVLHVSTNEVNRTGRGYAPRGPYAAAKACQELMCEACQADGQPVTIVVTQSLFGERQQPNKLVPAVIRSLLAGDPITLQRDGARWARRPFLHVRNLADALVVLAAAEHPGGRVNVGAERLMSVYDVVSLLAATLYSEARIEAVQAGDRPGHELDVEPIGCDLDGWRPPYEVEPALRDVARWYRRWPDWLLLNPRRGNVSRAT